MSTTRRGTVQAGSFCMTFTSRPSDISCSTRGFRDRDKKFKVTVSSFCRANSGKAKPATLLPRCFDSRSPFRALSLFPFFSHRRMSYDTVSSPKAWPRPQDLFEFLPQSRGKVPSPSEEFVMLRSSTSSSSSSSLSSRNRSGKFMDTCVCARTLICESVCVCHLLICAYLQIDQETRTLRLARCWLVSRECPSTYCTTCNTYVVRECFFLIYIYIYRRLYN